MLLDNWLLHKCSQVLTWGEEWLFISQKKVEQGLIGLFLILFIGMLVFSKVYHIGSSVLFTFYLLSGIIIFWGTLLEYRDSSTMRILKQQCVTFRYIRYGWLFVIVYFICAGLTARLLSHIPVFYFVLNVSWVLVRAIMAYVTSIASLDKKQGKKAKLAWSKIKELFGSTWVPAPQPQD